MTLSSRPASKIFAELLESKVLTSICGNGDLFGRHHMGQFPEDGESGQVFEVWDDGDDDL